MSDEDNNDGEIIGRQIATKLSIGGPSNYSDDDFDDFEDDSCSAYSGYQRSCTPQFVDQTKTFSQTQLDEIDRNNAILMDKILANNRRKNQYTVPPKVVNMKKEASASINRRKKQMAIDRENQILLKKLQTVKSSFSHKK